MSISTIVSSLFSNGVDKVISSVGDAIDKNITNDEERLEKRNELEKLKTNASIEFEKMAVSLEKEFTARHALDMQSDDKLSKRIRPLSLIYLLLVVTILSLTDGNIKVDDYVFQIKPDYIELFKYLLLMVFGFYYSSRGAEKVAKIWRSK